MTRIVFSLVVCLILASEAQAVRLMDGAEVGQMFGYVAACTRNVGVNPSSTQEDSIIGEKYGKWLQNNGANVGRVLNDMQTNLGVGMANAARSNYVNCENALREAIGFYEFFKLKGTGLRTVLNEYTADEQTKKKRAAVKMRNKTQTGEFSINNSSTNGKINLLFHDNDDLIMHIETISQSGVECSFIGICEITNNDTYITCDKIVENKRIGKFVKGAIGNDRIYIKDDSSKNVCANGGVIHGMYEYISETGKAASAKSSTPNIAVKKETAPETIREHNPGTAEERDDFLAFDREQQKKEQQQKQQSKAAPAPEAEEDMGPELPLGQLTLKDDYTTATMKLRFNSDGDLMMMINSTSSSKVDCTFEGMCEVQNGVVLVCTQFVDGKEMIATGEFGDTAIELLPSSTKSICPKGGVIDGTYTKK